MDPVPNPRTPIPVTTYERFQTVHGAPQADGAGPWYGEVSVSPFQAIVETAIHKKFCDENCYAVYITGNGFPRTDTLYDFTYFANVSYPKQDLPESGSVNIQWGFSAVFAKRARVPYPISSSVASMLFQSSIISVDYAAVGQDNWSGTSYRYNSSVSPIVYQDPSLVYFPLSIRFSFNLEDPTNYAAFFAKGFSFTVTPPTSPTPSNTAPSVAVIAGSVVGGVFLIGLIILMWILYRRRKGYGMLKGHRRRDHTDTADHEAKAYGLDSNQTPENPGAFVTPGGPVSRIEYVTPNSLGPLFTPRGPMGDSYKPNDTLPNQPGPGGLRDTLDQSSRMSTFGNGEAPPDYRDPSVFSHDEPSTSQPPRRRTLPTQLQTLTQYAEEHRNFIPEELEEKLRRAGYLPADDPDVLAEDAWKRDYGVTPFELVRLRGLYRGSVY